MQIPGWKRAIDLACCATAIPLLCVIAVVMLIVHKFASPGPILYKQERVGFRGSRFLCYKFRTMYVSADTRSHKAYLDKLLRSNVPMTKLDSRGDSRLIPGGWLLRALGLDELPQILNVLQGDMSIVGPRPCLPYEFEQYSDWHKERLDAIPGLTGLWQVSGKNRTTFDEMIRLDIEYSKNLSLWLDLKIIFMTVPALTAQVGDTRKAHESGKGRRVESEMPAVGVVAEEPLNMHGS
ncbi:MAG TPA: sugar transferase [Opitutaceae bacterium]